MKGRWIVVCGALLMAGPLAAQEPLSPSEALKKMTPEERAFAQRKLNAAAAMMFDIPLDSAKSGLRSLLTVVRDTVLVVQTEASRLQRASSPAVAVSTARRLRSACASATRMMIGTEPHIAGMQASAKPGEDALMAYLKAIAATKAEMTKCERAVATPAGGAAPSLSQLRSAAAAAEGAAARYDLAAEGLLRVFDIPMRPKGVPGRL